MAEIQPTYPQYLHEQRGARGSEHLAPATLRKMVQVAIRFLLWCIAQSPSEYRNLSEAWVRSLRAPRLPDVSHARRYVTLGYVEALTSFPVANHDWATVRDQAAAALMFTSGIRAGALGSLPIRALDLSTRRVRQWPELGVRTKAGKKITSSLLNIPSLMGPIRRWDDFVRERLPDTAMWYSPIIVSLNHQTLSAHAAGARRNVAIRKRIQLLAQKAGLEYFHPHLFRHGSAVYALQHARNMADYKAISQNLGHNDIRTTDGIYAVLLEDEVHNRIDGLMEAEVRSTAQSQLALRPYKSNTESARLAQKLHRIVDQLADQLADDDD